MKEKVERRSKTSFCWQYHALFTLLFLGVLTSSCKSTANIYESEDLSISKVRTDLVEDARSLIGSAYKYAAKGPKKFDCSGLVDYVYGLSNIEVGGSASSLANQGEKLSQHQLLPGDLVFFKRKGQVFHVSMVSKIKGDEVWVIHSTSSRGVIEEDVMASSYWRPLVYKTVSLDSYR